MEKIHVLLFYKFVEIEDPIGFKEKHFKDCKDLGLVGRVLVSKEGLNGSVAGTKEQTESYKKLMNKDNLFRDLVFKEETCLSYPFKRMVVKNKAEIINLGKKVDLSKKGKYISPKQLVDLYNSHEDFVILDARNRYEWEAGKFEGAVVVPIETFREFPKALDLLNLNKDRKIVTYCTGGIRCEKVSAYMKEQGFTDVHQLEGGILNFSKECPNTFWKGNCFVFDKRLVSSMNEDKPEILTSCTSCGAACDLYKNCNYLSCNDWIVLCNSCDEKLQGCCSKDCWKIYMQDRMQKI